MVLLNTANAVRLGSLTASKVYAGSTQVWPAASGGNTLDSYGTIVAHWDASDLTGSAQASWPSRVGGFTPVQATATAQPQRVTDGTLFPAVLFDGNDNLTVSPGGALHKNATGMTAIVKMLHSNAAGATNTQQLLFIAGGSSATAARFTITLSNNRVQVGSRRLDSNTGASITGVTELATNTAYVIAGRVNHNDATASVFINGTQDNTGAFQTTGLSSNTDSLRLVIGANGSAVQNLLGRIAKIVVYGSPLTNSQIAGASALL